MSDNSSSFKESMYLSSDTFSFLGSLLFLENFEVPLIFSICFPGGVNSLILIKIKANIFTRVYAFEDKLLLDEF